VQNQRNLWCLLLVQAILSACTEPVQEHDSDLQWFKGNLHTHSYWSDGDDYPEMIMDWYKSRGYDFLSLTDHNILAQGENWRNVDDSLDLMVFERYLDKFGPDWVEYKNESDTTRVRLKTFQEYMPRFKEPGEFLVLQAEEISDRFDGKPLHLNATNLQELIEPQGGNSVTDVLQRNINAVLQQREMTGEPMIVHINHPNFHYAITVEDMIALQGERFFEVFNGHPAVYNLGDSVHLDTETMWDQINIAYIRNGKPPLYGLATDDSHHYHTIGKNWSNSGRGWIWVQADTLEPASLVESMESGRFYASTGVTLSKLDFRDNLLAIEVKTGPGNYKIQFIGCNIEDSATRLLKEVDGPAASFSLSPELLFVRAKVIGDQTVNNPIENFKNQMAWTQPVSFVE
jgi:hypothetical protein